MYVMDGDPFFIGVRGYDVDGGLVSLPVGCAVKQANNHLTGVSSLEASRPFMIPHHFESSVFTDDGISRQRSGGYYRFFICYSAILQQGVGRSRHGACTHALKHSSIEYGVSERVGVHPYTVDSVPLVVLGMNHAVILLQNTQNAYTRQTSR